MRADRTPHVPVIYVDSDVYLDLIMRSKDEHADTGEERWKSAKELFDAINANQVRLAASALVEAEVLCNGETRRRSDDVRSRIRGWFNAASTLWTDVDRFLARDAAALAEKYSHLRDDMGTKMRAADATHLAAAIRLHADYLMTHDRGFPLGITIDGVEVTRPRVVWTQSLFDEEEISDR